MRCKACGVYRSKRDEAAKRDRCRACGTRFPVVVDDTPQDERAVAAESEKVEKKPATKKKKSAAKKGLKQ